MGMELAGLSYIKQREEGMGAGGGVAGFAWRHVNHRVILIVKVCRFHLGSHQSRGEGRRKELNET